MNNRGQGSAFVSRSLKMVAANDIFSGKEALFPGEQSPALILLRVPYAGKVFDRQSELDVAAEVAASDGDTQARGRTTISGAFDRAGTLFAHLRMGPLGLGITIGYFIVPAVAFWASWGSG